MLILALTVVFCPLVKLQSEKIRSYRDKLRTISVLYNYQTDFIGKNRDTYPGLSPNRTQTKCGLYDSTRNVVSPTSCSSGMTACIGILATVFFITCSFLVLSTLC